MESKTEGDNCNFHSSPGPRMVRRLERLGSSRRFSLQLATETIHAEDLSTASFYGPYAHVRKELDYTHHVHYTKNRQWLQDSIIEKLLGELVTGCYEGRYECAAKENKRSNFIISVPKKPFLIYLVGPSNSSYKNFFVKTLIEKKLFPVMGFILVDNEEICQLFPEYSRHVEHNGHTIAKSVTMKEAGYVAEILTVAALQIGMNVLVYSALRDLEWHKKYFGLLKKDFNQLSISILHLACGDASKSDEPCQDEILNEDAEGRIQDAVTELMSHVDYQCTLEASQDPNGIKILTNGEDWNSFESHWQQSSAYETSGQNLSLSSSFEFSSKVHHRGDDDFIPQFSVHCSTEENYQSNDMDFYGPFAHIRKILDYNYHRNYRRSRQLFQDALISDILNRAMIVDKNGSVCTTPTEPFLVFTAGAMGAGKSHTLRELRKANRFPLLAFVQCDPDEIRSCFPEFSIYVEHDALKAGEFTRKEAGYIVEILTLAALQAGKNVLVDGSLRDFTWYEQYFASLRVQYPHLKISILHIVAPKSAIFQRAKEREILTGRAVPKETLESAFEEVPKSVSKLKSCVDYYCALNNGPGTSGIEILTEGITWEDFEQNWNQTCAWIPHRKASQKLLIQN